MEKCGSISSNLNLGDNMHTPIAPLLALPQWQLKQWSVIQMKLDMRISTENSVSVLSIEVGQ